jgi:CheY-like chemotaxis protein
LKKQIKAKRSKLRGGSGGARLIKAPVATVLHIDDDPNDAELFEAAMRKAKSEFLLRNVTDGEQAMAYLHGHGVYSDRVRYQIPSLVLLDLKMPRATGFEVLKWIRSHSVFGKLPVVVLSGSELQDDIQKAYAVGANAYLIKPLGFNALVGLVKEIETQWLKTSPITPLNLAIARSEDFRSDDRL